MADFIGRSFLFLVLLIVKFLPFIVAGVILVLFARSKAGKNIAESYSDYIAYSVAKGVAAAMDNGEKEGGSEMTGSDTDTGPSILSANSETLEREAEKPAGSPDRD